RTCIYRVVQEALTNCARHAKARNVLVSVSKERNGIAVLVQDDGIGFSPALRGGLGLLGIQERVQALDGKLHIASPVGQGAAGKVELRAPVGACGEFGCGTPITT